MKKYLLASVLALSLSAHAGWVTITDSDEGNRLQYADNSFSMITDNGTKLIGGGFRMIVNAEPQEDHAFIITLQSCVDGEGKMLQRAFRNSEWVTVKTFYWSDTGRKIYDTIAKTLCDKAVEKFKKPTSKNGKDI